MNDQEVIDNLEMLTDLDVLEEEDQGLFEELEEVALSPNEDEASNK